MLTSQLGYVARAGRKGRGVFAKKKIRKGQLIEISPYIEVPPRDDRKLAGTIIESYWFEVTGKWSAIGLGLVSLYNHSEEPNASFKVNRRKRVISIQATQTIAKDQEILINYGYELN